MTLFIVVAIGFLIKSDSDIKGSGIPHVEGELKGLLHPDWWSVLWKKFVGGVLAISMGFMLGREGPSIQLGAMAGKGVAQSLKAERMEKRVLIASGAAAGLSAASTPRLQVCFLLLKKSIINFHVWFGLPL